MDSEAPSSNGSEHLLQVLAPVRHGVLQLVGHDGHGVLPLLVPRERLRGLRGEARYAEQVSQSLYSFTLHL